MKRIKHDIFQDGYEFYIPQKDIIATNMFEHDFGSGEQIPMLEVWYVVEDNPEQR